MQTLEKLRGALGFRHVLTFLIASTLLTSCANQAPDDAKNENSAETSVTGVTLTLEKAKELQAELPCQYPLQVGQEGDSVDISCLDPEGLPDWAVYAHLTDKDAGKKLVCITPIGRNLMGPNWTSFWTDDEDLMLKIQKVLGGEILFAWQICDQEGQ